MTLGNFFSISFSINCVPTPLRLSEGDLEDQFVISNGLISKNSNLVYLKADVYMKRFLYTQEGRYRGYPARSMSWGVFNPNGYSDHLPIFLFLGKKL